MAEALRTLADLIADATAFGRGLLRATSATAARILLGLGTAAVAAASDFAPSVHTHSQYALDADVDLLAPLVSTRTVYASRLPGITAAHKTNVFTGLRADGVAGTPADAAAILQAFLDTCNPAHQNFVSPGVLVLDCGLAVGPALKAGAGATITGRGRPTGLFGLPGFNQSIIVTDGFPDGLASWYPAAPSSGQLKNGITLERFTINGGRAGRLSPAGDPRGGNAPDETDGTAHWSCGVKLHRFRGVRLDDLFLFNCGSYGVNCWDCADVVCSRLRIESDHINGDGLHFNGGCVGVSVRDCWFRVHDDAVAWNTNEGSRASAAGLVVTNCYFEDCFNGLRVYAISGNNTSRQVEFSHNRGTITNFPVGLHGGGVNAGGGAPGPGQNGPLTVAHNQIRTRNALVMSQLSTETIDVLDNTVTRLPGGLDATAPSLLSLYGGSATAVTVRGNTLLDQGDGPPSSFAGLGNPFGAAAVTSVTVRGNKRVGRVGAAVADQPRAVHLSAEAGATLAVGRADVAGNDCDGYAAVVEVDRATVGELALNDNRHRGTGDTQARVLLVNNPTIGRLTSSGTRGPTQYPVFAGTGTVTRAGGSDFHAGPPLTDPQALPADLFLAAGHGNVPARRVGDMVYDLAGGVLADLGGATVPPPLLTYRNQAFTNAGGTVAATDGQGVACWTPGQGGGRTLTQGDPGLLPTYHAPAGAGKPAVLTFAGGQRLEGGSQGSGLPSGSAPRSVAAWVRWAPGSTGYRPIVTWGDTGFGGGYLFGLIGDGADRLGVFTYAGASVTTAVNLADGQWHRVGASSDGTTHRLYADGAPVGSGTLTTATAENGFTYVRVGQSLGTNASFGGDLAGLDAWDEQLTDAEFAADHAAAVSPA